jgi:hypothetical protein
MPSATFPPRPKYGDILDGSLSSATTKRGSISPNQPPAYKSAIPSSPSEPPSPSIHKSGRITRKVTPNLRSLSPPRAPYQPTLDATITSPKSVGRNRQAQSQLTISPARELRQRISHPEVRSEPQVLIRRVKTVVHVPVKQEDVEGDVFNPAEHSASDSASGPSRSASANVTRTTTPSRSYSHVKSRTSIVQSDEEEDSCLEDEIAQDKIVPNRNNNNFGEHPQEEDDEEEDDELRMGAEVSTIFSFVLLSII